MSNLLEQAIIDAAALKEAALKSAEASLAEKYSKELKESFEKILEQDEQQAADQAPADSADLGASPLADASAEAEKPSEEVFEKVPSSFLDGPDDELITITFDEIKKQIKKSMSGEESESQKQAPQDLGNPEVAASQAAAPPEAPVSAAPQQAMAEEVELNIDDLLDEEIELDYDVLLEMSSCGSGYEENEESELQEDLGGDGDASESDSEGPGELEEADMASEKPDPVAAAKAEQDEENEQALRKIKELEAKIKAEEATLKMDKQQLQDLKTQQAAGSSTQITSEEQELEEEMEVDYKPTKDKSGYLRTSEQEQQLQFDAALAKITSAMNEEIQKIAKENISLNKKIKNEQEANEKLSETLSEYGNAVSELKEEIQKLSVSNAKLLYTNKILENVSLNERQKSQIVESISRSESVKEAKTIYETLQSAVQTVPEKKQRESLSEALNRGASPFIARKQSSTDDNFSERMKILAGIK